MKNFIKNLLEGLIFTTIPAFCSYAANSNILWDKIKNLNILSDSFNVEIIKDILLWVGILLSSILLGLNLIVSKNKYDSMLRQRNALIKMNKDILADSLAKSFSSNAANYDIRIFVPKHVLFYRICNKLKIKRLKQKFSIKNIDIIADEGITKKLQFEVFPNQEGLVGICYNKKAMVFDDNLENTNSTDYNLAQNQIDQTSNLKWSICCPILKEDNTIAAIMAFDGKSKVNIDLTKTPSINLELLAFSRMLYETVPQLFRR